MNTTPKIQIEEAIEGLRAEMRQIVASFGDLAAYERSPVAMLYHDLNMEVLMLGGAIAVVPDDASANCHGIVEAAKNILKFLKAERLQILFGDDHFSAIMQNHAQVLSAVADHAVALLLPISDAQWAMAVEELKKMHKLITDDLKIHGSSDA